jgi:hypothetical protein
MDATGTGRALMPTLFSSHYINARYSSSTAMATPKKTVILFIRMIKNIYGLADANFDSVFIQLKTSIHSQLNFGYVGFRFLKIHMNVNLAVVTCRDQVVFCSMAYKLSV